MQNSEKILLVSKDIGIVRSWKLLNYSQFFDPKKMQLYLDYRLQGSKDLLPAIGLFSLNLRLSQNHFKQSIGQDSQENNNRVDQPHSKKKSKRTLVFFHEKRLAASIDQLSGEAKVFSIKTRKLLKILDLGAVLSNKIDLGSMIFFALREMLVVASGDQIQVLNLLKMSLESLDVPPGINIDIGNTFCVGGSLVGVSRKSEGKLLGKNDKKESSL